MHAKYVRDSLVRKRISTPWFDRRPTCHEICDYFRFNFKQSGIGMRKGVLMPLGKPGW
jgi:hypothetical protein